MEGILALFRIASQLQNSDWVLFLDEETIRFANCLHSLATYNKYVCALSFELIPCEESRTRVIIQSILKTHVIEKEKTNFFVWEYYIFFYTIFCLKAGKLKVIGTDSSNFKFLSLNMGHFIANQFIKEL